LEVQVKPEAEKSGRAFRIGKELYDKKFAFDIVSKIQLEEIYEKALKRKDSIHAEMAKISKNLWSKYFGTKTLPSNDHELIKMMIDTIAHKHVHS